MEDKIRVVYHVDDSWMLGVDGEDEYVESWDEEDGDEFVDTLCALVMERARARGRLL